MVKPGRIVADPARERLGTPATIVTAIRTTASIVLAVVAVSQDSKTLLVIALLVHWVGDSLDGQVARWFDCETRTGAVLDIMCDRLCAAAFYIGLAWLEPGLAPAIFVYLAEFMVVDSFLSIAFLAWPITSPNYFYVIDRKLWLLNWSHPGKAVNSGLFAILLLVTGWMEVGLAIAVVLLVHKSISLVKMMRLGLPISDAPLPYLEDAERQFGMDLGSGSFASDDPGAEPGPPTGVTHPVRR
ncbi:MAG: CDP-alcohol phosphatidyltransferase family protein [Marmoricola sp.]